MAVRFRDELAPIEQTRSDPGTQSHGTGFIPIQSAGLQEADMSYWDGNRWSDADSASTDAAPKTSGSRRANWAATAIMVIGAVVLILPLAAASAASPRTAPSLAVACNTSCVVGGPLTVRGTGFIPSAGGQQVTLWVEYPNDYCGSLGCHGFYYNPFVASDGTFSATFDNAVLQAGDGGVEAIQYNARTDKWVKAAYVDYATR
jgi:hypothetical protein